MDERLSFRLNKKSYPAYLALKQWCRANRVPMGRLMNAVLQAMWVLPHYNQTGSKHAVIDIAYPNQTNVDHQLRYQRYRRNLTRVKTGSNGD